MKEVIHNGMSIGTQDVPTTVNAVYTIAANWLKLHKVDRPGQAMMFVTAKVGTPVQKKTGNKSKGSSGDKKGEVSKDEKTEMAEKAKKLVNIEC